MLNVFHKIKFVFWFIFKAPQRKLGYVTLWQDIVGIFSFFLLYFIPFRNLKPVSICLGTFNRSELFLTKFLVSLSKVENANLVELSVFDCGTDDVVDLEIEIKKIWKGKLKFNKMDIHFSRSYSFNKAVKQSTHSILFICDADFSLPKNIVSSCNKYSLGKLVWFPIVFYLYKNKAEKFSHQNGEWMQWGGKGILCCKRKYFDSIGGLNESFTTWGQEDDELWMKFYKAGNFIIRNREQGLMHHWHPSLNPKYQLLADKADKGLL